MGKRNLITGVVLGSIVGGVVSLINNDTRDYAKEQLGLAKEKIGYIANNPAQSIRSLQTALVETAENAASSLDGALNAADQVENTINDIRGENQKKLN